MSGKTVTKRRATRSAICLVLCLLMAASMLPMAAAVVGVDLIVISAPHTRAEIAAMPSAEGSYTYTTSGGERTDTVRGVLLKDLLAEVDDDAVVDFKSVDNWAGMSAYSMKKSELAALNAMIAYEIKDGDVWKEYLRETDNDGPGYFALYVDGMRVAHAVNVISLAEGNATPAGAALPETWIGDATPEEHDFRIVGMVEQPGYYTIAGLIEEAGDMAKTKEYSWMNSAGSTDTDVFTGIYIEDLLKSMMNIVDGATGIIVTASDDYSSAF